MLSSGEAKAFLQPLVFSGKRFLGEACNPGQAMIAFY